MHREDFWTMAVSTRPRAIARRRDYYHPNLPLFLHTDKVHPSFGQEFVELMFREFGDLSVVDTQTIGRCLSTDPFGFGITPSTCMLSSFTLCGSLDLKPCDLEPWVILGEMPCFLGINYAAILRPNDLLMHCAPLLHKDQKLAPGFKLRVILATQWWNRDKRWYKVNGGDRRETGRTIHRLVLMMQAIKQLDTQLRAKCDYPWVSVWMLIETINTRRYPVFERQYDWTHKEWVDYLSALYPGRW
jgi:hypothetical protein